MDTHSAVAPAHSVTRRNLLFFSLAALGVVYGDIGTSPLYALRECFYGHQRIAVTPDNVLGVLSLIFWALIIVVSFKYLVLILRADNRGEGGILALSVLVSHVRPSRALTLLGLFGAALLYADGMITPSMTVLSAVEGLGVAEPVLQPYVLPVTVAMLVGLFVLQSRGTARVGALFGPVMILWFGVLAVLGLAQIIQEPTVLKAVNPAYGFNFFLHNGWLAFLILGAVFLVVTGSEALYADMGHFGIRPIRYAWFTVVLPSLMLNYFGQGALLLSKPEAAVNPFYQLAPSWGLYPLIILASTAAVIASQAVITGAFSLTMQAVQLGFSPRLTIRHTSAMARGQIYLPVINWALMIACIALVVGFGSSSNLAAAYGVAITSTMMITTVLFYFVARYHWRWKPPVAMLVTGFFLTIDLAFFSANITKIPYGGWFPLVVATLASILMSTWRKGRKVLAQKLGQRVFPIESLLQTVSRQSTVRVPGTAVFMYGNPTGTPPALLHNLKHNKVLHEQVIILNARTEEIPHVEIDKRLDIEALGQGFWRLTLHFGFMDDPNVPEVLRRIDDPALKIDLMKTSFFLGRETIIARRSPEMSAWRGRLFAWMSQNAHDATSFFRLPPNSVVELGAQVQL